MARKTSKAITLKITEDKAKKHESLHAYLVNAKGQIVESAPFRNGEASFKDESEATAADSRIYIAQSLPKDVPAAKVNELSLLKMNAYNVNKKFSDNVAIIDRLPENLYTLSPITFCDVRGHINKNFLVNGVMTNLPVCNVRVHICEVERRWWWPYFPYYYEIPDWVLIKLGQEIDKVYPYGPIDPGGPVERQAAFPLSEIRDKAQPASKTASDALPVLSDDILSGIRSGSAMAIKDILVNNHELLYPYICLWPFYWPWFYFTVTDTVVNVNSCDGSFNEWFLNFGAWQMNVYIWVEAFINGQWVTVYDPLIACGTHWNYVCGTDINITVTDPAVRACNCDNDGPPDTVWFRSIGESAFPAMINQYDTAVTIQGYNYNSIGCTNLYDVNGLSPFGATLNMEMYFAEDVTALATHYRWKYTQIKDANLNPVSFQPTTIIPGKVLRGYQITLPDSNVDGKYISITPDYIGTDFAFRIPHQDITLEPLVPAADQLLSPAWVDQFFTSASFDSVPLAGLYEFELELCTAGATGYTAVSVNKETFKITEPGSGWPYSSEFAPDNYLKLDSATMASALKILVRIDNAACGEAIDDVYLTDGNGHLVMENGQPVQSGSCGFIHYTDPAHQGVRIAFEATHPRNFAVFSFDVYKGNRTEDTGVHVPHPEADAYVCGSIDGFTLLTTGFTRDVAVSQLLGTCPQAAFAEELKVTALATDGTYRLNEYDAVPYPLVNAFALSNV